MVTIEGKAVERTLKIVKERVFRKNMVTLEHGDLAGIWGNLTHIARRLRKPGIFPRLR
jgi:hypothetical protein